MPLRSNVAKLPHEVRIDLERRMRERAFSGYRELAEKLQAQGYEISEDSLQRYGARHQRKLEAMDLAEHRANSLAATAPDSGENIIKAMLRLLRVQLFSLFEEAEQLELGDIARLTRTVNQLTRLTIAFQQWTDKLEPTQDGQKQAASRQTPHAERKVFTEEDYRKITNALLPLPHSSEWRGEREQVPELGVNASVSATSPASIYSTPSPALPAPADSSDPADLVAGTALEMPPVLCHPGQGALRPSDAAPKRPSPRITAVSGKGATSAPDEGRVASTVLASPANKHDVDDLSSNGGGTESPRRSRALHFVSEVV